MKRIWAAMRMGGKGSPGYTLVEVMVAMLITFIVLGGVYKSISNEQINQDKQEKILDMQNNVRVVLDRMTRDIRRAGFFGCGGTLSANTLSNAGTDTTWIQGYTLGTTGSWDGSGSRSILDQYQLDFAGGSVGAVDYLAEPLGVSNDSTATVYKPGTDALTLVYLSDEEQMSRMMSTTSDVLAVPKPNAYAVGDILYVGDCEDYAMFQATGFTPDASPDVEDIAHTGGLNNSQDLQKQFAQKSPASVYKYNVATYYLQAGSPNYALSLNSNGNDIANNIEDLQVQFLIDTNHDGNLADETWQDGLGSFTANDVRAIKIWILAMTDPVAGYTDNDKYDYPNSPYKTLTPAQNPQEVNGAHRYRYLASAVVYLRNAGLIQE